MTLLLLEENCSYYKKKIVSAIFNLPIGFSELSFLYPATPSGGVLYDMLTKVECPSVCPMTVSE